MRDRVMKSKADIKTTNPPILAEEPRGSYQGVGTFIHS